MPRKKRNPQSPTRLHGLPSNGKEIQSENRNINSSNSMGVSEAGTLNKDEVVSRMQEMFSHLDPDVVYIVLAECDFKVENAMDSLLVLSEGAVPPPVSGFEMAAALLGPKPPQEKFTALPGNVSPVSQGRPEDKEDADVIGTHLTADFDELIDKELESISKHQTAGEGTFSSSCSPSSLPLPELLQLSTEQGQGSGHVSVNGSSSTSPVSGLSFAGGRVHKEETGLLNFSHLTAEPVSSNLSSLDLGSHGRPSAFQAYRKGPKPSNPGGNQFMESNHKGANLLGSDSGPSLLKNVQQPSQPAPSTFWNTHAPEFMPRLDRPVFVTPVVQNYMSRNMQSTVDWMGHTFAMQAPLKPAATIPKSWAVSTAVKPPQPPRAARLFGQILVLMRGAPGSGKSTLARTILQQNPGGVVLSTDDYFIRDGRYCFDQQGLGEAHEWNQKRAKEAFEKGVSPIIIDNTNMQSWEMKPYVALALQYKYKIMFREPDTWWKCKPRELERRTKHGVQKEKIRRMLDHYDRHVSVDSIMCSFLTPVESSSSEMQPPQEACLSQPSPPDLRPDLVEEPHLNLESVKAHSQLFSSLPDVSSVGGCLTKDESLANSIRSSTDQTDSDCTANQYLQAEGQASQMSRAPEPDVPSAELQETCTADWEVDKCLAAPEKEILGDKETLEFVVEDQADQEPVAFFESISQRVRRDRGLAKQVESTDVDKTALISHDAVSLGVEDGGIEDSSLQTTGGDCVRPELLDFIGDWPTEALEQRDQRTRQEEKKLVMEKGLQDQPESHCNQKRTKHDAHITEFQKLLDLLQVAPETSQKHTNPSIDSMAGSFDLQSVFEDLTEQAADKEEVKNASVSCTEGRNQETGKNTRPELLNCVQDWAEADEKLAEVLSQKPASNEQLIKTHRVMEQEVDGLSVTRDTSISMPEKSIELQHAGLEECQSPCVTTCLKSASPAAGCGSVDGRTMAAMTGGSQERKLRQSRRSGKQCKLALTFTNNSPTSPKFQEDSPQLFNHLSPVCPDVAPHSSFIKADSATQTSPQDFALLWRIDRQHQINMVDLGVKVMQGNSSCFIPKSAEAVEYSGHQEVPYRVMHDKGTVVEEQELSDGNNKLENLLILSRHFKLVSFDTLEDLYDKCHQDMEWTTNLLLDSGERLFKDDGEDDAVVKGQLTECDGGDSNMSVRLCSRSPDVEMAGLAAENSSSTSFKIQCPGTESFGQLCADSEVTFCTSGELSNILNNVENSRLVEPVEEAELVRSVEVGNDVSACENPLEGCFSANTRTSQDLMDFNQEEVSKGLERSSETQIEKHESSDSVESERHAPEQGEVVAGLSLLEPEHEEIGDLLSEGEISQALQERIKELNKKQNGEERNRATQAKHQFQSVDIQTLELKLPTELAMQLTELFGPVGVDPSSLTPEDCAVQIDLNLARLLHRKWNDTIQERKRQERLSYCLLQESSVHWGDSQLAKLRNQEDISQLLLCPDGLMSLGHSDNLLFMDHWNASQPHVSLRDIMMEEEALQQSMEKLNNTEPWQKDSGTLLRENQLYSLFPTIDRHFLKDIFRDHNYSLERTEQFLRALLDEGPVRTVVAPETSQRRDTERSPSRSIPQRDKTQESEPAKFQDIEDPEYEDFRAEAVLQRKKQQECIAKSADANSRGLKDVASFYSQQGNLHGLKMKEANHRAAAQIFRRVNASLLPQNILDLHGLHVEEALYHLAQVLEDKTKEWRNGKCRSQLSVITGRGNHSQGGVARIRPAVIDYLSRNNYRFTEPKIGLLLVTLQ
ncbi:NEDD4-binding protein 2 isoform X1 [Arapaima gigas]